MKARFNLPALLLACLALPGAIAGSAAAADLYRITQTIPLGAPDKWDHVLYDSTSRHVFIAHGDEVTVVDPAAGRIIGQVTGMPGGTHDIAIAHKQNIGYTDDGRNNKVIAFDGTTLQTIKSFDVAGPDAVVHDDSTGHIFVVNGRAGKLTEIDPATNTIVGTIDVGGKLETPGGDAHGKLYVNGEGNNELVRIDLASRKVDARWPLTGCTRPTGLAVDHANVIVFSTCRNGVMTAVDGHSGRILATIPIGQGTDAAGFDSKRGRIFSSNGRDGTITVVHEDSPNHFSVIGTVKTQISGRTMAVNVDNGDLYVAAATPDRHAKPMPAGGRASGKSAILPGSLKLLVLEPVS